MKQTFVATFEKHIMKKEVYFEADPKDYASLSIKGNVEKIVRDSKITTSQKFKLWLLWKYTIYLKI
jgi:hypothetical protein